MHVPNPVYFKVNRIYRLALVDYFLAACSAAGMVLFDCVFGFLCPIVLVEIMTKEKEKKLTVKQEKFIEGYLEHGNGTRAALDAGYSGNSTRAIASENLTKPNIAKRIESYQSEAAKRVGISQEYVLRHLKAWAEKEDDSGALKALQMMGKHLRMFDQNEIQTLSSHEQVLNELEEMEKDD